MPRHYKPIAEYVKIMLIIHAWFFDEAMLVFAQVKPACVNASYKLKFTDLYRGRGSYRAEKDDVNERRSEQWVNTAWLDMYKYTYR